MGGEGGVCVCVWGSHLQRIRLGEVGKPPHPQGDPHVHHLGSDVAEGEVADHHLLGHGGVRQTHVVAGGQRRPQELVGGGREATRVKMRSQKMSTKSQRPHTHVVVAEHDSFGLSGGPGGVDEGAALVGLLAGDDGVQGLVRLVPPQLHELRPLEETSDQRRVSPDARQWVGGLTEYRLGLFSISVSLYWTIAFR